MTIQRAFTTFSIAIGSIFALGTAPATAFSFNSGTDLGSCGSIPLETLSSTGTSVSTVSSCTTADGITLTAGPDDAVMTLKEVNGVKGVGVFHDLHPVGSIQELDYGETITLSTASPSIFSSLDISFLYTPGNDVFGDVIKEVASITAGGFTGSLSVVDSNTAQWSWNGISQTISASSSSTASGGGLYRILDPFGTTAVSEVTLTSFAEAGQSYRYSDYGLSGAEIVTPTTVAVPEPSVLLGTMGLAGIVAFAFSRRSQSDRA